MSSRVAAALLVEDLSVYPRFRVDDVYARRLAEAIRAGAKLPPVVADRASKRIVDGFHRRRAALIAHGPEAEVEVEWRDYRDERELFLDAVRLNAHHGRRLSSGEEVRCLILAEELGLQREVVAQELGLRREIADGKLQRQVASGPLGREPLKPAVRHLAGEVMTERQAEVNRRLGGYHASYYASQLIMLLRSGAIDRSNEKLVQKLRELHEALEEFLLAFAE